MLRLSSAMEIKITTTMAGMTRNTLVIADNTSSSHPPRKPAISPMQDADEGGDGAGHQSDDQRGAGAVDEVGHHALALVVGAQQQRPEALRWVVETADHLVGVGLDHERADEADQDDERHDDGRDPESRV